jgi:hypothetical protein
MGKITEACDAALKKYGVGSCGLHGLNGTINVHLYCQANQYFWKFQTQLSIHMGLQLP